VDPRTSKLAKVLVQYSLKVKKGEWVRLDGAYLAEDLLREAYREVLAAGGHPTLRIAIDEVSRIFLNEADKEQMAFIAPSLLLEFKKADKFLFVMGGWNTRAMTRVDPAKMVASQKARRTLFKTLMKRTAAGEASWVGTLFPTQAAAQDAEMSLAEYEEFVFKACLLDKKDPVAEWKRPTFASVWPAASGSTATARPTSPTARSSPARSRTPSRVRSTIPSRQSWRPGRSRVFD